MGVGAKKPKRSVGWLAGEMSLEASASFMMFGGFVYLDKQGQVVKMTALGIGEGLSFCAPEPWRHACTATLQAQGRWQAVTMPFMRDKGAQY